jgi:shikimate dehydrogenase
VPDEAAFVEAVKAVREGRIWGANVTVPHKRLALALADRRDESAAFVGAANVLCKDRGGAVVAYNTDVPALAEELRALRGEVRAVLVLGSGGAALAAVAAAQRIGASEVAVTARRWDPRVPHSEWERSVEFHRLGARLLPWPAFGSEAASQLAAFCGATDVLVQATSAGMHGAEPGDAVASQVPWGALSDRALAYDLVYNPPETAFLRAARARGLVASHGLGMLVSQAALAIELWLGVRPPREPLYAAAEAALAKRHP